MKRITIYSSYLVPDEHVDAAFKKLTEFGPSIQKVGEGIAPINADITVSTTDQYGNDLSTEDD